MHKTLILLIASISAFGQTNRIPTAALGSSSGSGGYPTVITPEQYGAKRDGSTDDRAAIQAAIASLASTGGTVQFAAGHYRVASELTISTSYIRLKGAGATFSLTGAGINGTYIDGPTTGNIITIAGSSYTGCATGGSVLGFGMSGIVLNRPTAATAGYGMSITNACDVEIDDVISYDGFHGFYFNRVGNPRIARAVQVWQASSASVRYGFDIDTTTGGSFTFYCDHCAAAANSQAAGANTKGLYIHGPNITDIQFDSFETAWADFGIDGALVSQNATAGSDIRFIHPILDNIKTAGIRLTGSAANSATWASIRITDPYILLNGANSTGVLLDIMMGVSVIGGDLNCNGVSGSTGVLISASSSAQNRIIGTHPTGCATGVDLNGAITTAVGLNTLTGPGTTGIKLRGGANGNNVIGNIVHPNYVTGLSADTGGGNQVTGNIFYGTTSHIVNTGANIFSGNWTAANSLAPTVATCGTIGTGSTNRAGFVTSTVTGTCGAVLTFGQEPAQTGWSCRMDDSTTPANKITQTASTTTTATFTGTTTTGDVLRFVCVPY